MKKSAYCLQFCDIWPSLRHQPQTCPLLNVRCINSFESQVVAETHLLQPYVFSSAPYRQLRATQYFSSSLALQHSSDPQVPLSFSFDLSSCSSEPTIHPVHRFSATQRRETDTPLAPSADDPPIPRNCSPSLPHPVSLQPLSLPSLFLFPVALVHVLPIRLLKVSVSFSL